MEINKNLTTVNYNTGNISRVKHIVIHYTANNGDTAYGNTNYFKSVNRGASAHYFVDETSVWQCVEDKDIAWHCGASSYKHAYCRNANSIGVELCSRKDGNYYFLDDTVTNAVRLVKELMAKYSVPIENVIRHYDVTGKNCPEPYVRDVSAWNEFKSRLTETAKEDEEVVDSTAIKINGKEYTVNRILKDGKNYVCLADLAGKGFDVGYDQTTKTPSLNNTINELPLEVDGKKTSVEAVNIGGFNYVPVRRLTAALGNIEVGYENRTVIITQNNV